MADEHHEAAIVGNRSAANHVIRIGPVCRGVARISTPVWRSLNVFAPCLDDGFAHLRWVKADARRQNFRGDETQNIDSRFKRDRGTAG
jgi:hypothetical protein